MMEVGKEIFGGGSKKLSSASNRINAPGVVDMIH
jgi:hypothetical protein